MNSDHRFFNPNIINSFRSTLKNIHKIEETTSARNLAQFRERMAANKAAREQRAKEFRAKKAEREAAAEAERNTPQAKAAREQARQKQRDQAAKRREAEAEALRKTNEERAKQNLPSVKPGDQVYNPNSKASINPDGTLNIPPEAQARAANPPPRTPPQPGQVGGAGGYINPNSPEGRVLRQIQSGELPPSVLDTTRDSHRAVIDAVNDSPDPKNQANKLKVPERELTSPTPTPAPVSPKPAPTPTPPAPVPPKPTSLQPEPESSTPTPRPTPVTPNNQWDDTISQAPEQKTNSSQVAQLAANFMTAKSTKSKPTVRRMPIIPPSRVV